MKTIKSLDKVASKEYILDMKKVLQVVIPILLFVAVLNASAFLDCFQGHSEGDNIRIEWKTSQETNLDKFVIERKTPQSSYSEIATISPKGDNSFYSYLDESAYKTEDLIFTYRLRIVDKSSAVSYSSEVTVSSQVAGFKRTWGSIKAMFR